MLLLSERRRPMDRGRSLRAVALALPALLLAACDSGGGGGGNGGTDPPPETQPPGVVQPAAQVSQSGPMSLQQYDGATAAGATRSQSATHTLIHEGALP